MPRVCVFCSIIALYYSNIGKTKRKKTLQKRNNISIHTDSMPSSNSCTINLEEQIDTQPYQFFYELFVKDTDSNETYIDELLTGTKTSFKHLDVQSSEISGYSHFSYEVVTKDSKNLAWVSFDHQAPSNPAGGASPPQISPSRPPAKSTLNRARIDPESNPTCQPC